MLARPVAFLERSLADPGGVFDFLETLCRVLACPEPRAARYAKEVLLEVTRKVPLRLAVGRRCEEDFLEESNLRYLPKSAGWERWSQTSASIRSLQYLAKVAEELLAAYLYQADPLHPRAPIGRLASPWRQGTMEGCADS